MTIQRVYIAGAMSSTHPLVFLENLRKGMRLSTEAILAGYSVFSPFIDFQLFFQLRDGESIPVSAIKESSLDWMEVADAVLLVPGWEESEGTKAELNLASELGIPVFDSLEDMSAARDRCEE
jgi:nucleoside 2-deoxyribosyltransferase